MLATGLKFKFSQLGYCENFWTLRPSPCAYHFEHIIIPAVTTSLSILNVVVPNSKDETPLIILGIVLMLTTTPVSMVFN